MKEFENSWLIAKWGDVKLKAVVGNMKRFKSKTNFFFFFGLGNPSVSINFTDSLVLKQNFSTLSLGEKVGKILLWRWVSCELHKV